MATKLSTDVIDLSGNTEALTIPKGATSNVLLTVDYLVIAGGGGGGGNNSGGGGAGGYLTSYNGDPSGDNSATLTALSLSVNTAYTVTVGAGGAGVASGISGQNGGKGENSVFATLTATGGGGGRASGGAVPGDVDGGSGGGGGHSGSASIQAGGTGTALQGGDGGDGIVGSPYSGGGGGGASGDASGINGANGLVSTIDGGTTTRAGGGGGGQDPNSPSSGGTGGGGAGGTQSYNGGVGTVNTGSGGGGGGYTTGSSGGAGGSGIIILRYPNIFTATYTAGAGGAADSEATVGTDKYIKITAGTGTVAFSGTPITTGRPTSPTEGLMRENTTTGKMEFYDGSLWQEINDTASSYSPGLIPSANFNTALYTGNGGADSVAVGFQSELTWIKARDTTGKWNVWYDIIRGTTNMISSNSTSAAQAYGSVTPTSTGFDIGSASAGDLNTNGEDYVSWNWKAGGAATTIASGTNGSTVASDVSANQAAGFSIVQYTTAGVQTISHGLSKAPEIIINKISNAAVNWNVYTQTTGTGHLLKLNLSDATAADSVFMTAVGADTFSTKWSDSTYDYINYCWHSVPGYSKIGFYVGNGNSTGPTVYTGFKPAWLMIKDTGSTGGGWYIYDNKRDTSNPNSNYLRANQDTSETTGGSPVKDINFLDTGFQIANSANGWNFLGNTFIYMTFSE